MNFIVDLELEKKYEKLCGRQYENHGNWIPTSYN